MSCVAATFGLRCKEFVEVITEYLDGTLPPAQVARVDQHLERCHGCRAYLGQMRQTIKAAGALRDQPGEPVPDETKQRLLRAFRDWKAAPQG